MAASSPGEGPRASAQERKERETCASSSVAETRCSPSNRCCHELCGWASASASMTVVLYARPRAHTRTRARTRTLDAGSTWILPPPAARHPATPSHGAGSVWHFCNPRRRETRPQGSCTGAARQRQAAKFGLQHSFAPASLPLHLHRARRLRWWPSTSLESTRARLHQPANCKAARPSAIRLLRGRRLLSNRWGVRWEMLCQACRAGAGPGTRVCPPWTSSSPAPASLLLRWQRRLGRARRSRWRLATRTLPPVRLSIAQLARRPRPSPLAGCSPARVRECTSPFASGIRALRSG